MIFRWSVWGTDENIWEMLSHSVGTFRRFFGSTARYLVVAEDADVASRALRVPAEIVSECDALATRFRTFESTWRKWWPRCRLDPSTIEFHVDADIFLLRDPVEIRAWLDGSTTAKYLCTLDSFDRSFYGNFESLIDPALPFLNAGFLGQGRGVDLSDALAESFEWWQQRVQPSKVSFHDEQGAVAKALEPELRAGQVALLPAARYRVICPLNEQPNETIDDVVLLHATFPHRPAFWRHRDAIAAVSGVA